VRTCDGSAKPALSPAALWSAQAYKYVPFGLVAEVLPYLIRRAQENSTVLGGVAQEKALVAAELGRRMRRGLRLSA